MAALSALLALWLLTLIFTVEDASSRGVLSVVEHVSIAVSRNVVHFPLTYFTETIFKLLIHRSINTKLVRWGFGVLGFWGFGVVGGSMW